MTIHEQNQEARPRKEEAVTEVTPDCDFLTTHRPALWHTGSWTLPWETEKTENYRWKF